VVRVAAWCSVVYGVIAFVAGCVAVAAQRLEFHDVSRIALVILALTGTIGVIALLFSKRT
jgi:hypothetical protein